MNPASVPNVVKRYFDAQSARDFDALVGLFTKDGVVYDEGKMWEGACGIREWREKAASTYQYTTEVLEWRRVDENEYEAEVRLEGNFPGGVVELEYRFTLSGELIEELRID